MTSFFHNFFHSFSPSSSYSYPNYQPYHESLLGTGPKDWLSNAAVFAGTDYLLNRYDENHDSQVHYWRNAGLAGALALGFQHFRNNHHHPYTQDYVYPSNAYMYGYGQQNPSTMWNPYGTSYYGNNNSMMFYPYAQPMGPQVTNQQPQMLPYYPSYM